MTIPAPTPPVKPAPTPPKGPAGWQRRPVYTDEAPDQG